MRGSHKKGQRFTGRRRKRKAPVILIFLGIAAVLVLIVLGMRSRSDRSEVRTVDSLSKEREENPEYWKGCPHIDVQLLTPNRYSRPQIALKEINAIVIHYTANPGATAQNNRDYFEGLKDGKGTKASSHFIVGLDGEVIQCIPSSEMAYANNPRNHDTLSIECCHPDESGKFNDATYQTVVQLAAWLCKAFQVSPDNVIRHYDVSGKNCPKYYVEHEDAWTSMKADIKAQYKTLTA